MGLRCRFVQGAAAARSLGLLEACRAAGVTTGDGRGFSHTSFRWDGALLGQHGGRAPGHQKSSSAAGSTCSKGAAIGEEVHGDESTRAADAAAADAAAANSSKGCQCSSSNSNKNSSKSSGRTSKKNHSRSSSAAAQRQNLLLSRQALRGLLLARLNPGTVRWGCVLAAVEVLGSADEEGDDGDDGDAGGKGNMEGNGEGAGGDEDGGGGDDDEGGGIPATRGSAGPTEAAPNPSPETNSGGYAAPLRLWVRESSDTADSGAPADSGAVPAGKAAGAAGALTALTALPYQVAVLVGADGVRSCVRGLLDRVATGTAHGRRSAAAAVHAAAIVAEGRPAEDSKDNDGGGDDTSRGRFFAAGGSSEAGLVYLGVVCVLGIVPARDYRPLAATAVARNTAAPGAAATEAAADAADTAAASADGADGDPAAAEANARVAEAGGGVDIYETVDGETRLYRMPFSRGAHNGKKPVWAGQLE